MRVSRETHAHRAPSLATRRPARRLVMSNTSHHRSPVPRMWGHAGGGAARTRAPVGGNTHHPGRVGSGRAAVRGTHRECWDGLVAHPGPLVRSAYPPERLAIELQSRLGPPLAAKGYCIIGHGVTGVTWRREPSGRLIAGLLFLGVFSLGSFASATAVSLLLGVVCLLIGCAIFYTRRPASVTVSLRRAPGGTEISVSDGPDATTVNDLLRTFASSTRAVTAAPAAPPPPSACDACGAQVSGNFCANCGKSRTRTCSGCEQVGLTSDFCPACGAATYEPPMV